VFFWKIIVFSSIKKLLFKDYKVANTTSFLKKNSIASSMKNEHPLLSRNLEVWVEAILKYIFNEFFNGK